MIGGFVFAEPNEMQAGRIPISDNDITANLPYNEDVRLCSDHNLSEAERDGERDNVVIDTDTPSAARVIFDHFGGKEGFPLFPIELMSAVDKADSADYSEEEILAPADWTL